MRYLIMLILAISFAGCTDETDSLSQTISGGYPCYVKVINDVNVEQYYGEHTFSVYPGEAENTIYIKILDSSSNLYMTTSSIPFFKSDSVYVLDTEADVIFSDRFNNKFTSAHIYGTISDYNDVDIVVSIVEHNFIFEFYSIL